jgi:flagellin-like hook-associated protein FlgL
MSFRINTNIAGLNTLVTGNSINKSVDNSLEKLSSGMRINKAADDASGLMISNSLKIQANTLGQSIKNANDGIAIARTADKAIDEQSKIVDVIKQKAIQAAQDGQNQDSRKSLQKDIDKLMAELNNIASTTSFNGKALVSGTFTDQKFQIGANSKETASLSIGSTHSDNIGQTAFKRTANLPISQTKHSGEVQLTFDHVDGMKNVTLESVNLGYSAGEGLGALESVVNKNSTETGIRAVANVEYRYAKPDQPIKAGTTPSNFAINGINIGSIDVEDNDSKGTLVNAINSKTIQTGVTAWTTEQGALRLKSDGRGIKIDPYDTTDPEIVSPILDQMNILAFYNPKVQSHWDTLADNTNNTYSYTKPLSDGIDTKVLTIPDEIEDMTINLNDFGSQIAPPEGIDELNIYQSDGTTLITSINPNSNGVLYDDGIMKIEKTANTVNITGVSQELVIKATDNIVFPKVIANNTSHITPPSITDTHYNGVIDVASNSGSEVEVFTMPSQTNFMDIKVKDLTPTEDLNIYDSAGNHLMNLKNGILTTIDGSKATFTYDNSNPSEPLLKVNGISDDLTAKVIPQNDANRENSPSPTDTSFYNYIQFDTTDNTWKFNKDNNKAGYINFSNGNTTTNKNKGSIDFFTIPGNTDTFKMDVYSWTLEGDTVYMIDPNDNSEIGKIILHNNSNSGIEFIPTKANWDTYFNIDDSGGNAMDSSNLNPTNVITGGGNYRQFNLSNIQNSIKFEGSGSGDLDLRNASWTMDNVNANPRPMFLEADYTINIPHQPFTFDASWTVEDLEYGNQYTLGKIKFIDICSSDEIAISGKNIDILGLDPNDDRSEKYYLELSDINIIDEYIEDESNDYFRIDYLQDSIDICVSAISHLDKIRSDIGSFENQLVSTLNNISTTKVNLEASKSQIIDTDFAKESANFEKNKILVQSGNFATSQSNEIQKNIVGLLK